MYNSYPAPHRCPHCFSQLGQEIKSNGVVMCGKCTNTYLYGANPEVEDVDVDDDDNDGDDDDDDLNSSFTILPPRNHDLSLLTQMKEEQSSNQPFRYKFSDDSEEDQLDNDDEADIYRPTKKVFNSTSKRVATKKAPKPKAMTKPLKRKRETSTKSKQTASSLPQDDNDEYNSAHLPAIFSDSIISQEKPKGSVPYKDGELSFSDDDDDGDLHIEHEKSKRTKQENDEDQPDQIINKYSIGGQRPKEYAKTKARSRRCVPLQQYSPFVRFNGDMRGTIARMNQEQLKNSEFPQRTLSRLVANAWNQMTKDEKNKYKEKLTQEKKALMSLHQSQKSKRPSGNGYLLYNKEQLPKVREEFPDLITVRDLSAIISVRWKGLDEQEKKVYKDKALKEKDEWIKENPEEYQDYLDRMCSKIKATKKARREEKTRQRLAQAESLEE